MAAIESSDDSAERFALIEMDLPTKQAPAPARVLAPAITVAPTAPVSPLVAGRTLLLAATTFEALDEAAQDVARACGAAGMVKQHPTRTELRGIYTAVRAAIVWLRLWAFLRTAVEQRPALVVRPTLAPEAPAVTGDALIDALMVATTEAATNAATQALGSMAGGQLRGVGFSSAAGYVGALAHGVKQATADSYKSTLRSQYNYSPEQIAALQVTIIPEGNLPVGAGITHTPVGGKSVADMTSAEIKATWAKPIVNGESETMRSVREAMKSGEVIAVADAVASGKAVMWDGLGEFSRAEMLAVLAAANLPESWCKAPTSPKALAGLVITGENRHGLIAKPEKLMKGARKHSRVIVGSDGMPRQYTSRWTIQEPTHGEVGEKAGTILATATVWIDGSLTVDGDESIKVRIETEYNRRRDAEVFEAGQVTAWLQEIITGQWHGIMHYGWYIPAKHVDAAMRLYTAIEGKWGRWRVPMPMVTCDALRAGLTKSLADEVNTVLANVEKEYQAGLAATPRRMQIGPARAASFLAQLSELGARASKHVEVLGGGYTKKVRDGIAVAMRSLEGLCSDGDIRASLLELNEITK